MPREVHETYEFDPDHPGDMEKARLTGFVVITRESEWDDKSRERAMRLTEWEDSLCHCGCGLPRAIAEKEQGFIVHDVVCWAGKAIEELKAKHRETYKDNPAFFRGRHYFAVPARQAADN